MIIIIVVFGHLFAIVCLVNYLIRYPIAFDLTKLLVSIAWLFNLGLWLFDHSWSRKMDILGLLLVWSIGGLIGRPVDGSINLNLDRFMLLVLILQLFSWAVLDQIIFLNNHVSISDIHQNCLRTLWDYQNHLDLHLLWSPSANTMLQGSSVGTSTVTPLLQ